MPRKKLTDREREDVFWSHVVRRPSGCWEWKRPPKSGYGRMHDGVRTVGAHVFSYRINCGPVSQWVLHSCDNPACVKPTHLRLGDHRDNMRDKERRGRGNHPRGERHYAVKLSDAQVASVRTRRAGVNPPTIAELARELGVTHECIRLIDKNKNRRN